MLAIAPAGSVPRVLVVDDHPDSADTSCMLLSKLGYACCAAVTGKQAIARAEEFRPSVVICDIGLPDISGYEVARVLRSRYGALLYIAALTGWDLPGDRNRAFEAGFDQHLIKPADLKLLREIMSASTDASRLLS
jgi:CheY-like chemotaxis protein